MYSILLVEDHKMLAEALANILRWKGQFEVVEIVGTAAEALERLPELQVDLVLVDIFLPRGNGIDLVEKINEEYPLLPCLMLSAHTADRYVRRSLEAGARGYVVKDDIEDVIEGIRHVLDGGIYLSKQVKDEQNQ